MAAHDNPTTRPFETFYLECTGLLAACDQHFERVIIEADDMLYAEGTVLYKPIDLMLERGLMATIRMTIARSEAISFNRIANQVMQSYLEDRTTILEIRQMKRDFNAIASQSKGLLDLFWNTRHLHVDMSDERFMRKWKMMRSCSGPVALSSIFDVIYKLAEIAYMLADKYVAPELIRQGWLHEKTILR